jgi:hypothetical protein
VQQEKCGRKSAAEKVRQKKCDRKIMAEKVRQKNHSRKIVAEKLWQKNQKKCGRKMRQQHGWGLFMRDMAHLV